MSFLAREQMIAASTASAFTGVVVGAHPQEHGMAMVAMRRLGGNLLQRSS